MKKDRDCKSCHSGAGRNPVNENIPRNAGQNLTAFLIKPLDSGLRRNDEIGSLRRAERAAVPPNMPM
jgi:hypothetical protein